MEAGTYVRFRKLLQLGPLGVWMAPPLGDSIKGNECTLLINSSLDSADG